VREREQFFPLTYKGIVVDLTTSTAPLASPEDDADVLLRVLMREFGGRPVTARLMRARYLTACDWPYAWQMVSRPLHARLRGIHVDRVYKGWKSVPVAGERKVRMRTFLMPTQAEADAADLARQNPDQVVAMHQRG
jgi:hypothetical protein